MQKMHFSRVSMYAGPSVVPLKQWGQKNVFFTSQIVNPPSGGQITKWGQNMHFHQSAGIWEHLVAHCQSGD